MNKMTNCTEFIQEIQGQIQEIHSRIDYVKNVVFSNFILVIALVLFASFLQGDRSRTIEQNIRKEVDTLKTRVNILDNSHS